MVTGLSDRPKSLAKRSGQNSRCSAMAALKQAMAVGAQLRLLPASSHYQPQPGPLLQQTLARTHGHCPLHSPTTTDATRKRGRAGGTASS